MCENQRVLYQPDATQLQMSVSRLRYLCTHALHLMICSLLSSIPLHPWHDEVPRSAPAMQSSRLQSVRTTAARFVVDSSIAAQLCHPRPRLRAYPSFGLNFLSAVCPCLVPPPLALAWSSNWIWTSDGSVLRIFSSCSRLENIQKYI